LGFRADHGDLSLARTKIRDDVSESLTKAQHPSGFAILHVLNDLSASSHQVPEPGGLQLCRDRERARINLTQLRTRLSEGTIQLLLRLLVDAPDPDQALNFCERLVSQAGDEFLRTLADPTILRYALVVFGRSYWLGEALLQSPEMLSALRKEKSLERFLGREAYRSRLEQYRSGTWDIDIATLLARFKKREYVRILLRDALGIAQLAETSEEISALADVIIQAALEETEREMRARYGPAGGDAPGKKQETPFAVLSLGKLGGNELNYSSDLDLLYLHGGQETGSGSLSLREYFVRQGQKLTELLSRSTPEGAIFRIDLRLRPEGGGGEPVVGLEQALQYYSRRADDWELQALIKARYSAGDAGLAQAFMQGIQPLVYTENMNLHAIDTALRSRQKLGARRRRRTVVTNPLQTTIDVKLDRGGIRDIEFLVQCLQRVYGGAEPWLRSGGTLFSLQKLHDRGHLSGPDYSELTVAYEFLRKLEHCLQLQRGLQMHEAPRSATELEILCRAAGLETQGDSAAFMAQLRSRMTRVSQVYDRVIQSEQERKTRTGAFSSLPAAPREMSFAQVLERVASDSPALSEIAGHAGYSLHTRRSMHRYLSSALTSADRYQAVLEDPKRVGRAAELFEASEYLTDILIRHPDAIRALDQLPAVGVAGPPTKPPAIDEMPEECTPARDTSEALTWLRRGFRRCAFALGAEDVLAPRPAALSMRDLTRLGESAIRRALQIVDGQRSLAVFALGRLGTEEFDIASDADLLFVRAPEADEEEARLAAERLVHALSAYTKDGTIFAVDARLRPHGGAGDLVATAAQVERYLAEEARAWEALTYTKFRFVAGRKDVEAPLVTAAWSRIVAIAVEPGFAQAVTEMRARLEKSNRYARSFKLARGGFYDIDFMASYLLLRQASPVHGNTFDRLQHLREVEAIDQPTFAELNQAALLYRTADHVIRLVTGRARPELPEAQHARAAVEKLVSRILTRDENNALQGELEETAQRIRTIFERIIR
jgi:glutamate-ammonia-ligase adenylyltransferase